MKKESQKQKNIKKQLIMVYKEIAEERDHSCSGCGRFDVPLSHSHLIPRSRRKDLVCDKRNIVYHCMGFGELKGCHSKWESKERVELLDFQQNMEYIKEVDSEYYYLIK